MAGEERNIKVKIDNVKKSYQGRTGEVIALNGVNLDIKENEFITVVGPSGCGKSTLLNIIAGLLEPTSGKVICNGKEVKGTGQDRGVVFQQYALFPWLTVQKNVEFALNMKGIKGAEAAMRYAKEHDRKELVIYHDYEGIAKWCLGEWKANKEGTKAYKAFYDAVSRQIQITFVKVKGHSGDTYNEMADQLAKQALGL